MGVFSNIVAEFGSGGLLLCFVVMFLGGFAKGVVGFALPMVVIAGIGGFLSVELAILALLIPSLVTNVWQSLRAGTSSMRAALIRYWRIFLVMPVVLAAAAQVFIRMSDEILFLVIGGIVLLFAAIELLGLRPPPSGQSPALEWITGVVSGLSGGFSGIWGPPIMMYLMTRGVPKKAFVQTMGLVFLIGAIVLNLSHLRSGILTAASAPLSAAMLVPALSGMWLGHQVQDRLDQEKFRTAVLIVLLLAGANLLRRGLFS